MKLSAILALALAATPAFADNAPDGMPTKLACSKQIDTHQPPNPNCHPAPGIGCPPPIEDYGWAAIPIQYVQDGDVLRGLAEIDDNFFSVYKVNFELTQDQSVENAPITQKIDITVNVDGKTYSGPNPLSFPLLGGTGWLRCQALK